jgi:bifunctional enzyme CysN/CysC
MTERPLRIVIVGHVDHGKSTLVGHLLHQTGSLPEGKVAYVEEVCRRRAVPFEWAFVMDALQAERNQNVTIDAAQIWFRSARRSYVFIDVSGHREFLKNMVTGAAGAEVALVLLAADEGIREQSRRHAYLLGMLGIKQVVVLVNKMDLVGWRQDRFDDLVEAYRTILADLELQPRAFIPIAARLGTNLVARDATQLPWYEGPTVIEVLDGFDHSAGLEHLPLRFPVQDVYRFDSRRILAGRLEAGTLNVGDPITFGTAHQTTRVRTIETWNGPQKTRAVAGQSIGITLEDPLFIERSAVATSPEDQATYTTRFVASLFWMGPADLHAGRPYRLKLTTQEVDCHIAAIDRVINAGTLETSHEARETLRRDDVAHVTIETATPILADRAADCAPTGRFVLVDAYDIAGGGIITGFDTPRGTQESPARRGASRPTGSLLTLPAGTSHKAARELEGHLVNLGLSVVLCPEPDRIDDHLREGHVVIVIAD